MNRQLCIRSWVGIALALILAGVLCFTFLPSQLTFADEGGTWVYVDGEDGDDGNDGATAETAVKTWAKAKELLGSDAGGIYVAGPVEATGTISTVSPETQAVKRAPEYTGLMFTIPGGSTVSFKDIDVDGEGRQATSSAIIPDGPATVNFYDGACFHDLVYEGEYYSGGTVLRIESKANGSKALIDGAAFLNNRSKFGGVIYAGVADMTVTVRSGLIEGNESSTGSFYINTWTSADNRVFIYNGLVTGNSVTGENARGAIYICGSGNTYTMGLDGAGIFDNIGGDIAQGGTAGVGLHLEEEMLGGGAYNWTTSVESPGSASYVVGRSTPSEEDKAKAKELAVSIFRNNTTETHGAVIESNGTIRFGRELAALEIRKVDQDDSKIRLSDAEFTLTGANEFGTEIEPRTAVTSDNGTLAIEDIPPGNYTLTETNAPDGYMPSGPWTVQVDTEGNLTVTGDNLVQRGKDTQMYYVIDNALETKDVKVSKQIMGQGKELAGAELTITGTKINGKEIEPITWTSDGEGAKELQLAPGEYTLTEESAPDGYFKAESITFTVTEAGEVLVDGQPLEDATLLMEDDYTKVTISKTDITGDVELAGAKLQVLDEDGEVIEEWISEAGKSHAINGKLLPGATYTLKEITAPKGYEVAESITFTVNEDGTAQTVIMRDEESPVEDEPKPEKTIEGGSKYTLKALDEEFGYEISMVVPEKAGELEIVDQMVDVLQFGDKSKTKVTIGGEAFPADELETALSQKGNCLKLKLNQAQCEKYAGQKLVIKFKARLVDNPDLSEYADMNIPNVVRYNLDNTPGSNTSMVLLNVPEKLITGSGTPTESVKPAPTERVASVPVNNDTPTGSDSGNKGSGTSTGDSTNVIIPILLALLAVAFGSSVAVRRRAHGRK